MQLKALMNEIHENAVQHGWWEDERDIYEVIALIHSEWSEALEEARKGMPDAYIEISVPDRVEAPHGYWAKERIPRSQDGKYLYGGKEYHGKPEGICVELIDGCIRILDFMGALEADMKDPDTGLPMEADRLWTDEDLLKSTPENAAEIITYLHLFTSLTFPDEEDVDQEIRLSKLVTAMSMALTWVAKHGIDPLELMLEKHEYNKGRPYKHGKKF